MNFSEKEKCEEEREREINGKVTRIKMKEEERTRKHCSRRVLRGAEEEQRRVEGVTVYF